MGKVFNYDKYKSSIALVDDNNTSVSYEELLELENKVKQNFEKRCLVMILTSNTIGSICSYASFLNNGFAVILVSSNTPKDMINQLMNSYRPSILAMPKQLNKNYPFMKEKLNIYDYAVLSTNYPDDYPIHDELGLLLTTSGSTGSVKYVRQSFNNIIVNARNTVTCVKMIPSDRTITVLPMHYTYGLSIINASLSIGACMVVTNRSPLEDEFWNLFVDKEVTAIHAVSNTYDMLRRAEIFEEDFPHLRILSQAGSKLPVDLHDYLARYALNNSKEFIAIYGQCEATSLISSLPFSRSIEKEGSIGIAVEDGIMSLKDEFGNTINEPNKQGEIYYEGPNVAMGYALSKDDLNKGFEWNEGIRTGDIAYKDEEGFYYIVGRLKRFIKMFGNRTNLDEIDNIIMESTHIRSVSSGFDDHLVIFVTGEAEKTAVTDFISKKFLSMRSNFEVKVIEEFPLNESGKIKYSALLDLAK